MGSVGSWAEQQEEGAVGLQSRRVRVGLNSKEKGFWPGKNGTMFKMCSEISFDFDHSISIQNCHIRT